MESEQKVKSIFPNAIALAGMRNRWIVWEDARFSRHLSNTAKKTESAAYAQAWREIQRAAGPEHLSSPSFRSQVKRQFWNVRTLRIAAVCHFEQVLHEASSVLNSRGPEPGTAGHRR